MASELFCENGLEIRVTVKKYISKLMLCKPKENKTSIGKAMIKFRRIHKKIPAIDSRKY